MGLQTSQGSCAYHADFSVDIGVSKDSVGQPECFFNFCTAISTSVGSPNSLCFIHFKIYSRRVLRSFLYMTSSHAGLREGIPDLPLAFSVVKIYYRLSLYS